MKDRPEDGETGLWYRMKVKVEEDENTAYRKV